MTGITISLEHVIKTVKIMYSYQIKVSSILANMDWIEFGHDGLGLPLAKVC